MFVEDIRRAITAMPRERLAELSAAVWKGYAAGAFGEDDAQALAEAIEARKTIPPAATARRRVGSRPRSPESMERRRRWVSSGWIPPQIAVRFTLAEAAVLAVLAAKVVQTGRCTLTLGHIAALAGVCRTTARTAMREARLLGLITVEEWRINAWRNAPNTVKVISPEWTVWLRMAAKRAGGFKGEGSNSWSPRNTESKNLQKQNRTAAKKETFGKEEARLVPSSAAVG